MKLCQSRPRSMVLAGVVLAGNLGIGAHAMADTAGGSERRSGERHAAPPQLSAGELVFLARPPAGKTPHSRNSLKINPAGLAGGWVDIEQCYDGLDAVPEAEVVYRYRRMRNLRVLSSSRIARAYIREQSVQLVNIRPGATLCVAAQAQILYAGSDGRLVLRNGPYHRRFLDGYFPLHVTLDIRFPAAQLAYLNTRPEPVAGFRVRPSRGRVQIDAWFAGTLNIEVWFARPHGQSDESP